MFSRARCTFVFNSRLCFEAAGSPPDTPPPDTPIGIRAGSAFQAKFEFADFFALHICGYPAYPNLQGKAISTIRRAIWHHQGHTNQVPAGWIVCTWWDCWAKTWACIIMSTHNKSGTAKLTQIQLSPVDELICHAPSWSSMVVCKANSVLPPQRHHHVRWLLLP